MLPAMRVRSPGIDLDAFSKVYAQTLRVYVQEGRIDTIAAENLQALDELIAAGREVMLLTSRDEDEVAHFLAEDHPLAGRVSAVFHAGSTTYLKPDPRAFDVVVRRTGFNASECVYVGDSPGDALAAHGAGLWFIGCLQSGLRARKDFDAAKVHAFVEDFPEIVTTVAELDDVLARST